MDWVLAQEAPHLVWANHSPWLCVSLRKIFESKYWRPNQSILGFSASQVSARIFLRPKWEGHILTSIVIVGLLCLSVSSSHHVILEYSKEENLPSLNHCSSPGLSSFPPSWPIVSSSNKYFYYQNQTHCFIWMLPNPSSAIKPSHMIRESSVRGLWFSPHVNLCHPSISSTSKKSFLPLRTCRTYWYYWPCTYSIIRTR